MTWDSNTWASGWTREVKTHTVDGVTITAGGDASARNSEGGLYMSANNIPANTITFSSDAPFNRIEFTKVDGWNGESVSPLDGWSVSNDGTTVILEGTATKSLVCQTCTLYVSKIKFYLESAASNEVALTEVQAGKQWQIASMPAGNVTLNVEYEPAFTATFKALTANTIQAGKATVTVTDNTEGATAQPKTLGDDGKLTPLYEGQTITLTAQTGYKFRTVTAKKGAAAATARTLADATADDLGKIVGADGYIYDTKADAEAVATGNAVAMIAYVDGSHGLAIALADESLTMDWATAKSTCENKTAVGTYTWHLPSKAEWMQMCSANGGSDLSFSGLNTAITNVGGNALISSGEEYYWSSTEDASSTNNAWDFSIVEGWLNSGKSYTDHVRAVLAF